MLWLFFAISSYFCFALSGIFVKYLVSKETMAPKAFVFYIGLLGMLVFVLAPFVGFSFPSFVQILLSAATGFALAYSSLKVLEGLEKFDASRIIPAIGGLVPLFTFAFVFIVSKGHETFSAHQLAAFVMLLAGILLLTMRKGEVVHKESLRIAVVGALFLALSFIGAKYVYVYQSFWQGLISMRLGGLLLSVALFAFSKEVRQSVLHRRPVAPSLPLAKRFRSSILFLSSQVVGALAEILRNVAIYLVPLALLPFVNALQGTEYAFVFLFALILSHYFPHIVKEETAFKVVRQKVFAITFLIVGLLILSFST